MNLPSARSIRILPELALLAIGLCSGFLIAERQIFPHSQVLRVWERLSALVPSTETIGNAESRIIETNLLRLRANSFPWTLDTPSYRGGGGGLTVLDNTVIGVDKTGTFFRYDGAGVLQELPLTVTSNLDDLQRQKPSWATTYFRFLDIAARHDDTRSELFVSYNFWYPDEECKTTRVSRIVVDDVATLASSSNREFSNESEVIFESQPCLEFSENPASGFRSNVSGGRLVPDDQNGLFVSLGDHHLDGVNNAFIASQDSNTSYGKILHIDLGTLEARVYANGIRNPQGLFLDGAGNLWETEHGPKGGDELNLILEGRNYGWPLTTLGTQYYSFGWEKNPVQGRHQGHESGIEKPIHSWIPSKGLSNLIRVEGNPRQWTGDLLISSLSAQSLFRARIQDDRILFVEPLQIHEQIRDLVQKPDGTIVLWTDSRKLIELSALAEFESSEPDVIGTCGACHSFVSGMENPGGPNLWGVFGREMGSTDYMYSDALRAKDEVWNEEKLREFLVDTQSVVTGTTMPPLPMPDPDTVDTLIAFLRTLR